MFDLKKCRDPKRLIIQEAALVAIFLVFVVGKPFTNALVSSGISPDMAYIIVGVFGFFLFVLMEKVWKKYGPDPAKK